MDSDLSERVAKIEAREEIRELVARYGMAIDDRDMDKLAAMFTVDAVFRHGDNSYVNNGREEIVAFYTERLVSYGPTYHYPHSHVVEFTSSTRATGIVSGHAELALNGATFAVALRYHDSYHKVDDAWCFAERSLAMLYFMDLADLVAGGLAKPDRKIYLGDVGPTELPEPLESWKRFFA